MFDDMYTEEVVWDDDLQHMFDQHGLLKELAQAGECNVGENKFMVKGPLDEPPLKTGAPLLLELGMASVHVVYDEMPQLDVIWDKEVQHSPNSHGLLTQLADDQEYLDVETMLPIANQIAVQVLSLTDGSSMSLQHNSTNTDQMFNDSTNEVVWDEERLYRLYSQDDYLQQNSLYDEYWIGKDNKKMAESAMHGELTPDRDTPFLLGLAMDHVDEMSVRPASLSMNEDLPFVPETHGMLLQQVAWDKKHFDYEMRKSIAEIALEDVLFDVGSSLLSVHSFMQVSDQVCMFELFINSYRMELKYKKAYISSQWDPGILDYGTRRLTSRREFLAGILLREMMPYELYAKIISLKRTIYMGFIAFCNSVNQIMIHEENSPSGFKSLEQQIDIPQKGKFKFIATNVEFQNYDLCTQVSQHSRNIIDENCYSCAARQGLTITVLNLVPPWISSIRPGKFGIDADCLFLVQMPSLLRGGFSSCSKVSQLVLDAMLAWRQSSFSTGRAKMGRMEMNSSVHKWDRLSPTKHIDAATNHLCEGAAAVMVLYPVVVEMKMHSVCMAYNAFGVIITDSSTDNECFSLSEESTICTNTVNSVDTREFLLAVLSVIRQYDPGGSSVRAYNSSPCRCLGTNYILWGWKCNAYRHGLYTRAPHSNQMVLIAMKWWQEHFSPWKSNSGQHCSEKMSHLDINVFSLRDGVQQHYRIVKRLCCSPRQYDPELQDQITYGARFVGENMVSNGKLLLASVERCQSNMVPAHMKPTSQALFCITIQQYSSINESSCLHY